MTTARDLVTSAMKKSGIIGNGQVPSAEDINDGFNDLRQMLATWIRKRWLVFHLVEHSFTSNGAQFFTIGPSPSNFVIDPRPDRLEYAYMVQPNVSPGNPVSYSLEILEAREDYAAIALKSLVAWPQYIFYDSAFPQGKVYVWPIPQSGQYEIHILTKAPLQVFTNLSEDVNLPLEYENAIIWNLVTRLRASYPRAQSDPILEANLKGLAKDSLNLIRNANTQVPRLKLPGLLGRMGRSYDLYSDNNS